MIKWKDIKGYENIYQVSNTGEVKSLDRFVYCKSGYKRFIKGKILKIFKQNSGYYFVGLTKNNKTKQFLIHRLVAMTFIENCFKYPEINHKDGNKSNNNILNLEWCSRSYNKKHMYDNLLSGKIKKENLSKALKNRKLTDLHKSKIGDSHRGIKSIDACPIIYLKTNECFGSMRELSRIKNIPFSTIQKDIKHSNYSRFKKITKDEYLKTALTFL